MRRFRLLIGALFALALAGGVTLAGGAPLKSGLQVGDQIPGAFYPFNVTGASAGKKNCLVCQHGTSPVAMVFAREPSSALSKLMKTLDENSKNPESGLGSFVIFLSDKESLVEDLKALAEKEGLKHITLAIDSPKGPAEYKVARDAALTVVLYNEHKVRVNFAFTQQELNDQAIAAVVKGVEKFRKK